MQEIRWTKQRVPILKKIHPSNGGQRFYWKPSGKKTTKSKIRCMTRNTDSLSSYLQEGNGRLVIVYADVQNYSDLIRVICGVDTAFYLIHSMEGSSKEWKKFAERDRDAAEKFSRAVTTSGVRRVIYLGGLTWGMEEELSKHMRSRREVGEILKKSSADVTIFRAAIILSFTISCRKVAVDDMSEMGIDQVSADCSR